MQVIRYSDGMKGSSLGLVVDLLFQLDAFYDKKITGIPEPVRKAVSSFYCVHMKIHYHTRVFALTCSSTRPQMKKVFDNRWKAFHSPIGSAAFCMHPQFCRREFGQEQIDDTHNGAHFLPYLQSLHLLMLLQATLLLHETFMTNAQACWQS